MEITADSQVAKILVDFGNLQRTQNSAIRKAFYSIGKDLVRSAVDAINTKPKSGRIYRISTGIGGKTLKRLKDYRASAEGEAPGVITGDLRASINFNVIGSNQLQFGVDETRKGVTYGKYLEYGDLISMTGQGSSKIKPRPYLSKSYLENKGKMVINFSEYLKEALSKK